jgi:Cof subfamily protein (haloacid dehalogenase superfamily)
MADSSGTITNNDSSRMKIRLVVSDVDGTLVTPDKRITPAAVEAIRRVRERGIKFTVISSRPPQGIKVIADVIGLTDPVPAFNGGLLVRPDLHTVMREKLLEPIVVARVLETLRVANVSIWLYTDAHWYVPSLDAPYVQHEIAAVKYQPAVYTSLDSIPKERVAKIVAVSENFDRLASLERLVQEQFRGATSATRSQDYYLDITHPGANKGEGILLLSELLDIPTSEIATIGDADNDVSMFQQSGLSIAMGNAVPEVQKQAMFVAGTNEHEGFAKAIHKYILCNAHEQSHSGPA